MDLFDPAFTAADPPVTSGSPTKTPLRRPLVTAVRTALPLVAFWVLNWTALGARLAHRRQPAT